MTRLEHAFAAIDAANALDPGLDATSGDPAALLYGQRMSARLAQLVPDAGDALAIAVRGQHIERWAVPRDEYPMDRAGYFRWRNDLKDRHAKRLSQIMSDAGYEADVIARTKQVVRKERFKVDPQAQALEDVACLVFLEFYAPEFIEKHDEAKVIDIVAKTWAKMSALGQAAAMRLALKPAVRHVVERALAEGGGKNRPD